MTGLMQPKTKDIVTKCVRTPKLFALAMSVSDTELGYDSLVICSSQSQDQHHYVLLLRQLPNYAQFFAQLFKKLNLCPLKLRSYWINVHQVFTHCRGIVAAINACIYKLLLHSVAECESKDLRSISKSAQGPPKLIGYHSNIPWATAKLTTI